MKYSPLLNNAVVAWGVSPQTERKLQRAQFNLLAAAV
jgi:hypothetical protein